MAALLGATLGAWGCSNLIGLDKDYAKDSDAAGGTDAAGGAAGAENCTLNASSAPACPAEMKGLPGGFCIDKTEVTWGAYEAWLSKNPKIDVQEPFCSWNQTFAPTAPRPDGAPDGGVNNPVANVDWCDAYEYCRSNSKHLCGAIDYKNNAHGDQNAAGNACKDQWYSACSSGGNHVYTYGEPFNPTHCNTAGTETAPVQSFKNCRTFDGNYLIIYDMTGNVWEWVDACSSYLETGDPSTAGCDVRGGGWIFQGWGDDEGKCKGAWELQRAEAYAFVGFRCCSNP
jgi:formylglycine-generating enzyme required for sulfatase activity